MLQIIEYPWILANLNSSQEQPMDHDPELKYHFILAKLLARVY
jgi:hypothetical protein